MKLESKFGLGDTVWFVHRDTKKYKEKCKTCDGGGRLNGMDDSILNCPLCFGKGFKWAWTPYAYRLSAPLTIGQVRVSVDRKRTLEEYMCEQTGIDSGTLYKVKDLFLTQEEGQDECDKLNKETDL